jgi:AAA family ATP:ADP antiporter
MMHRRMLAPAAVLFTVMVAHAILETAREALFLANLGPERLAWAYLAIAGGAMLAVLAVRHWGSVRDPRRMLIGFLCAAALGTALLALTIPRTHSAVFVLYVWTGLVATLVVPAFWTTMDRSLRLTQAKQTFAAIGAGGILGAMIGSAVAGLLGRVVAPATLVSVGAVAFGVAAVVAIMFAPRPIHEHEPRPRHAGEVREIRPRRYVRWILVLGIASTMTFTLGDLLFKRVVSEALAPEDLATAFGAMYTALNLLALTIQLVITPRLL